MTKSAHLTVIWFVWVILGFHKTLCQLIDQSQFLNPVSDNFEKSQLVLIIY